MNLIDNWRQAWRYITVQLGALMVAWGVLPAEQQAAVLALVGLPAERITAVMGLLVIAGRIVSQTPKGEQG